MMKTPTKFIALLSGAALLASSSFAADSVATTPVGYSTWEIAAGTGTARTFTTLALPLYQPTSSVDGAASGVIASVTSSTLTVTSAGWTAGELSNAAAPFCLRVTSGAAEGRNLLVSTSVDNTADTLTVDLINSSVADLTTLGIVSAADTFELIECDTLSSLFGEPSEGGLIGGAFADADNAWLFINGSWSKFYYNTTLGRWTRFFPGNPDASNQVVLPDSGILFSRIAAEASEFVVTGTVPQTGRLVTINQSGLSVVGSSWPVDVTLAESNIAQISEWQSSSDFNSADTVWVLASGSWQKYYHDGSDWRRRFPGVPISNDVVIPSGSAVLIQKSAAATGVSTLEQSLPYTL